MSHDTADAKAWLLFPFRLRSTSILVNDIDIDVDIGIC